MSVLLTFSSPRLWLFAEIKNDKELPPRPTPIPHLQEKGLLPGTQERRMGDTVEPRAGGVRERGSSIAQKEAVCRGYVPGRTVEVAFRSRSKHAGAKIPLFPHRLLQR